MASRHSSHPVMQYEWNTSSSSGVCLECVCKKRWRNKDVSRDLYSPDRETKRWRDKIRVTKTKEKRRSKAEIVRVRNNLFSLCAWLVGVLYLTLSPNIACLCRRKYRKKNLSSLLISRRTSTLSCRFSQPKTLIKMFSNVGKSETPALPFIVNGEKLLFGFYIASVFLYDLSSILQ